MSLPDKFSRKISHLHCAGGAQRWKGVGNQNEFHCKDQYFFQTTLFT